MILNTLTYTLAKVPRSIFQSPAHITLRQRWRQSINIATWLRYQEATQETCELLLRVEDSKGVEEVPVDHARIISSVVLLSSQVSLKLTGPVQSMTVLLKSPTPPLQTDELYVQAVKGAESAVKRTGSATALLRPVRS